MSLTMSEPDSKLPENPNVSSSIYESPSKSTQHSNGKEDLQTPALNESKSMNENGTTNGGIKNHSSSNTPPPLEPIPPSLFPGESAKIYSGMPPLISSSSKHNDNHAEKIRNGDHHSELHDSYVPVDPNSKMPAASNGNTVSSPQLMPPPLTNMTKARPNGYGGHHKVPENGHYKPRYPDSSHDIYSVPPGPYRPPYPGPSSYHSPPNHQSPYINTNGNSQYYRYNKGPLKVTMPTSTAGRVHLVNGDFPHPQSIPRQGSSSNVLEDNGEIINVDEDVDLERMYLDLITEEYTATVKRLVNFLFFDSLRIEILI